MELPDIIRDDFPKPDKGIRKWVQQLLSDHERVSRYFIEFCPDAEQYLDNYMNEHGDALDVDRIPSHWFNIAIDATLRWIKLVHYWILRYTGIYQNDEAYRYVFRVGDDPGVEIDPDMLLMFSDDYDVGNECSQYLSYGDGHAELCTGRLAAFQEEDYICDRCDHVYERRNQYGRRKWIPWLDRKERAQALPFVRKTFERWKRVEGVNNPEFMPPDEFLELAIWAVFIYVMSPHGRDWIEDRADDIYSYVIANGVAYQNKMDKGLIEHTRVYKTGRVRNTCADCGIGPSTPETNDGLYCVRSIRVPQHAVEGGKHGRLFLCHNCIAMRYISGLPIDESDKRVKRPACPHIADASGKGGTCTHTCPHSGVTEEVVWDYLEEQGNQRAEAYSSAVDAQEHPELGWSGLDELDEWFD
jgi:hypothetical protein